jgi:hypothetical protein
MQRRRSPDIRRPTEGRRVADGDVSGRLLGVHAFPWCTEPADPTVDSQGRPGFVIGNTSIDIGSAQWMAADKSPEHPVGIAGEVPVDVG